MSPKEPSSIPKFTRADIEDPSLIRINSFLRSIFSKVSALYGAAGPVDIKAPIEVPAVRINQSGQPANNEAITFGTAVKFFGYGAISKASRTRQYLGFPVSRFGGTGAGTASGTVHYVSAAEIAGSRYVDEAGLAHCQIAVSITAAAGGTVGIWVSKDAGVNWSYVGVYEVTTGVSVVNIDALPPVEDSPPQWMVAVASGNYGETTELPDGAVKSALFTVAEVGNCPATDITGAIFLPEPSTGLQMTYRLNESGVYAWDFYELNWQQPAAFIDPTYWYSYVTWQKGRLLGGVWFPAPDAEGGDENAAIYHGQYLVDSNTIQGGLSVPGTLVRFRGNYPAPWTFPPAKNPDGSVNYYRSFRFWVYAVSALAADAEGKGAEATLQTCWPGGADHYDLTPASQPPALDLTPYVAVPLAILAQKITIANEGVTNQYLADQAVQAENMAIAAVTAANQALAANAVVDANVASVNVSKLIAGTVIFTGTVVMSRGTDNPVIVLDNTGMFLYGVSQAGGAGLTSKPYVVIQSTGIGILSGLDPAVTVKSTGITLWSKNADATKPYVSATSAGITIRSGDFTTTISASQITNVYSSGVSMTLNTAGLKVLNGTYSVIVGSTYIQLWSVDGNSAYPCVGLTSTALSFTAGNYVTEINASEIRMYHTSGSQLRLQSSAIYLTSATAGAVTRIDAAGMYIYRNDGWYGMISSSLDSYQTLITMNRSLIGGPSVKIGCVEPTIDNRAFIQLLSDQSTWPRFSFYAAALPTLAGMYVQWNEQHVGGAFHVIALNATSAGAACLVDGAQVLGAQQTGLAAPTGWADATAEAWALSLHTKLAAHGLIVP